MQRVDHRAGVREFAGVEDEIAVGRRPAVVDLHVRARVAVLDDLLGVLLDLRLVHAHLEARPRGPDGRTHHAQVGHGARALLRERLQDAAVGGAHVRVGREADGCVGAMTRVVRAGETECSVGRDAALDAIVVVVAAAGIVHAGIILGDALLELVARRRAGHVHRQVERPVRGDAHARAGGSDPRRVETRADGLAVRQHVVRLQALAQ
mmetsp:Transcript_30390/g.63949  ORF Transcript_30390/g.63949 Transcript_30390/m.63949 type:complete len:208 (-) Transcript_30390:888-1511(-)